MKLYTSSGHFAYLKLCHFLNIVTLLIELLNFFGVRFNSNLIITMFFIRIEILSEFHNIYHSRNELMTYILQDMKDVPTLAAKKRCKDGVKKKGFLLKAG